MAHRPEGMSDASILQLLGVTLLLAGIVLLLLGLSEMTNILPPTYGQVVNVLFGLALGFLALITGFLYTQVAANGEDPVVDEKGLSITRDPITGAREWIKFDSIVKATLRPWTISPWYKTRRYFELELEVKEGGRTVDDRFFVHLGADNETFPKELGEFLGERLRVNPSA